MRYLSVCSGIEAVSVAWQPLGWQPAMFAEIDPFCCWLLRSRYRASRPIFMPSPHDAPDRKEAKRHAAGPLFALTAPTQEPYSSPSTPSPEHRSFAWQDIKDDANLRRAWLPHSLPLQPEAWPAAANGSVATRSQRRPCGDGLQQSVSIERHLSRIFPAHPRSLAQCLSRALRHGTALLFRLSENLFSKSPHRTRTKRFSEPSENAPFGLGSGAHSRRFAQECPEGNPGKS